MKSTHQLSIQEYSKVLASLVGTPYTELDCWGVVRELYKRCFDIELNNYYDLPPNDIHKANKLIYTNKGDLIKVEGEPEFGDIILIFLFGVECHIAAYIGDGKILHTNQNSGCMIDKYSRWERRISGVYRIKL